MAPFLFSILLGCQDKHLEQSEIPIPKEHSEFLSSYGWEIKENHSYNYYDYIPHEKVNEMSLYKEYLNDIKQKGGIDLTPFLNEPILEMGYVLQNTPENYTWIQAYVYESDGKVGAL